MADFGKFKNPFSTNQQQYIPPKFTGNRKPTLNTVSNNQKSSFNSLKGNNPFGSFNTSEPAASTALGLGNSDAINQIANNNAGLKDVMNRVNSSKFNQETFMPKLFNYETLGGKMPDRVGSQYKGIAQLGKNERTPIIKSMGYTEEQYNNSRDIQKNVANKWISNLSARLEKNGFDVTPTNVAIAHNQGVGGLNQILKGNVSPTVLSNIRNQSGMNSNSTPQDFIKYMDSKFSNF